MLLMHGVPAVVGAIGLAAVFSAEISAADAVLFMLTTSLSQDLYKRVRQSRGRRRAGAAGGARDRGRRGALGVAAGDRRSRTSSTR